MGVSGGKWKVLPVRKITPKSTESTTPVDGSSTLEILNIAHSLIRDFAVMSCSAVKMFAHALLDTTETWTLETRKKDSVALVILKRSQMLMKGFAHSVVWPIWQVGGMVVEMCFP